MDYQQALESKATKFGAKKKEAILAKKKPAARGRTVKLVHAAGRPSISAEHALIGALERLVHQARKNPAGLIDRLSSLVLPNKVTSITLVILGHPWS